MIKTFIINVDVDTDKVPEEMSDNIVEYIINEAAWMNESGIYANFVQQYCVQELKEELLKSDVVVSEALPQILAEERFNDITLGDIAEILDWAGESEYISVEDILLRWDEIKQATR